MPRTFTQELSLALDRGRPGTVALTVGYELHPDVSALEMTVPDWLSVERASGFEGQRHRWTWDGRDRRPWVRFALEVDRTRGDGYEFVDTGSWALLRYPPVGLSVTYTGAEMEPRRVYTVEGQGVASSDGSIAYLGAYEERRFDAGGQRFRLVVPAEASLRDPPEAVESSLRHAAAGLSVGGRNDEVVVVAAPSTVEWGWAGLQTGSNGFWAVDSARVNGVNNTWVHEYVHTRQEWGRHSSTEWLVEGTTEFYAAVYSLRQGRVTFPAFRRHVATDRDSGSVLRDPGRWTSSRAHYTKGRRVTAALDAEIRRRTGGDRSFEDVFRRLNRTDGDLTHAAFKAVVREVAGPETAAWVETYVEGPAAPEVPGREARFVPGGDTGAGTDDGPRGVGTGVEAAACPVCGQAVRDREYCTECGAALSRQCPVCAHEVGNGEYCPECGTQLSEECEVCGRRRHGSEAYCPRCGSAF